MRILFYLILPAILLLSACKSESPVAPPNNTSSYNLVLTASSTNTRVEIYSATANRFITGYNSIGFKIFINDQAQTTGFVKFLPKMYHSTNGGPTHNSPASPIYNYDGANNLFTGYVSYTMASDTLAHWFGFVNYNNTASVDSFTYNVFAVSTSQMIFFDDMAHGHSYYLTLASPFYPEQKPNKLQVLLHRTDNDIEYTEVDDAVMYIRPWMEAMGHGSSNNRDPVYVGGGIYEGQANFNMSGVWYVYDSIKVNNEFITPTPPPKFIFNVP